MIFCAILISIIRCSFNEETVTIEEMLHILGDGNVQENSELHRYFSSPDIKFYWNKEDKQLIIFLDIKNPFVSEELVKLKNLEKLSLSGNNLKMLPYNLGNLINLLELDLKNNIFTEIPPAIFKLEKLRQLNLNLNNIIKIPGELATMKNLQILLLSNNLIENISSDFNRCISIKFLNLSKNRKICRLTSNNTHIFHEMILFSKLPTSLEHLDLSNANIYFMPETLNFPNLLFLELSNNCIKNLYSIFENLNRLQILNLDNNEIGEFPSQLYRLNGLINLTMRRNLITEIIIPRLSRLPLELLVIDDNPLEKLIIYNTSFEKLSVLSLKNIRLKSFVIKYSNITNNTNINEIETEFINVPIKELDICFERLDYIGDLFSLIELRELSIRCINQKTLAPHDLLLQGFSNLQNLRNLTMEHCGLQLFPKSLVELHNLQTVDLSYNLITEVPSFIKDLSVKKILLEKNLISKIPVEIFYNTRIEYIGLRNNKIETLPINLSKHSRFNGIVDISSNKIELFGNRYFSGVFDIPYTMIENIIMESKQLVAGIKDLEIGISMLTSKSKYSWIANNIFSLKAQKIKEHTLEWNEIYYMFNMLKNKISDTNLQDSTLIYLKKVYQIEETPRNISIMYGESQRNTLKNYIEEILKLLLIFLEKNDNSIIENCFILLQNAHNVCFDGQLEHLIEIHKSLAHKDLNCLETTIYNILVKYKYEGLKLITTSNSYNENVHLLSFWRNSLSKIFGFEKIPHLYSVTNTNVFLDSKVYLIFQMFKYLEISKIVLDLTNEINENSNLMVESTKFLFQLFEEDLEKFKFMVEYDGDIEELLITGITVEGVEAILLEYNLIESID